MCLAIEMSAASINVIKMIRDKLELNYSNNNFNHQGVHVMRLTVRQRKIFELLWSVRDFVTVKFISQQVSFSEKTIRSDLDCIKNAIDAQQVGKLTAKTNRGFFLDIERSAYEKISANYIGAAPTGRVKNRTHNILIVLLQNSFVSSQDLADSIYLDKRSLKKYFDEAEEWLVKRNIVILKNNSTYQLCCDEIDYRRALWDLFIEIKELPKTAACKNNESILSSAKKHHIDIADVHALTSIFKKEVVFLDHLQTAINNLEVISSYKYTYDAYIWILFSTLVVFQRRGQTISLNEYLSESLLLEISDASETTMTMLLVKELQTMSSLTISRNEAEYLTACLLCAEYNKTVNTEVSNNAISEHTLTGLIKTFIFSLSHVVGTEITKDKLLLQRIFYLLKPMIYRHRFRIKSDRSHTSQALVRQVKSSYLDLFLEVELCCEIFNQRYMITLSEIDMSLITLCIRNAQSSAVKKIKISIICNHGMGISHFIAHKIQRAISQVEIVDVLSLREIDCLKNNNSDLVICTTPLESNEYQVIQVNDTLMPYDLTLIKETVKKMQKMRSLQSLNIKEIKGFQHFIRPDMVFISHFDDKYQALESISRHAEQLNLCEDKYLLSVFDREKAAPTQIGPGIVLTHGYPDWVKANFISISLLTKPLLWSDDFYVDIVIMVGLKKAANGKFDSSIAEFYSALAALIENDDLMKSLRSCHTSESLFDFFININNVRNIHERV